jgi:hypothetical protein
MPKFTLTDAYIAINGTALSDHANNVDVADQADQIEFTAFGPSAYKEYGQGMKDATITVDFYSDFAANSVHQILQPLYQSGGTFSVEVRPTSAAASATNPKATMTSRIYAYTGISGKVGDAAQFTATFQNAGTAGLVYGTA